MQATSSANTSITQRQKHMNIAV